MSLDRDHCVKEYRAYAIENARKDEEEAPKECEALPEKAREEERDDERFGIVKQRRE